MKRDRRVVTEGFHGRVFAVVAQVPRGRVTTYGDVAAALGSPRVARHVGWALAACTDDDVPWHRVIAATGRVAGRGEAPRAALQEALLRAEGVVFDASGRVDLRSLRHTFVRDPGGPAEDDPISGPPPARSPGPSPRPPRGAG